MHSLVINIIPITGLDEEFRVSRQPCIDPWLGNLARETIAFLPYAEKLQQFKDMFLHSCSFL